MRKPRAKGFWKFLSHKRDTNHAGRRGRKASHYLGIEPLEPRSMMSANTLPVTFHVPSDLASETIYAEVSGQLTTDYTTKANTILPSGSWVYYNADPTVKDYALASGVTDSKKFSFALSGDGAVLDIPNTDIKGGQIAMGIGAPLSVSYTSGPNGGVSAPTPATNPTTVYGIFEYAIQGGVPDIDLSEIDQVGFSFKITTTPTLSAPVNQGAGITRSRKDLFNLYLPYINSLGNDAQIFKQSFEAGNVGGYQYRIVAPQDVVNDAPSQPTLGPPSLAAGGGLTLNQTYYYWITATSSYGETTISNYQNEKAQNISKDGVSTAYKTIKMAWDAFPLATGYNVYRSTSSDSSTAHFIGSTTDLKFKDDGLVPTSQTPPANSYTFYPYNSYFNSALDDFFNNYTAANSFVIYSNGHLLKGQVSTTYQETSNGPKYTVLELTASDLPNQTFRIFKPYFQENTNMKDAPPAPTWMPQSTEAPGVMVFANNGAFNTGGYQPGVDATTLSAVENQIVSAFNRGIATNYDIAPSNWANQPLFEPPIGAAGGSLSGAYFYVVTTVNADGESPIGLERRFAASSTLKSAKLSWIKVNGATQYNVYRSQTQGSGYQLIKSLTGNYWTDDGSLHRTSQTPSMYYAPGSTSNWYAAFLHQNGSNNWLTGVSVNGLAYGYPYDDQGAFSTDMNGAFTSVSITIQPWGKNSPLPPTTPPGLHNPGLQADSIQFLTQPTAGRVSSLTTLNFRVLDADGFALSGGDPVTVDLVGLQKGTYSVNIDRHTGLGTLTFTNSRLGFQYLRLKLSNGNTFQSNVYQVLDKSVPLSLMNIFDNTDNLLTRYGFYKVIDSIAKYSR